MTEQAQLTPAEASTKLETLKADPDWGKGFLAGDGPKVAEFQQLTAAAQPDHESRALEMAIGGQLFEGVAGQPPGHMEAIATAQALREAGLGSDVIRQVLTGAPVTQAEHDAATRQKAALLRDNDFCKNFLAKNGPEVERMALLDVVLTSPIKSAEKAA
jgi:hypothetical protein